MLASFVNTCFGALDPPRGHRPVFLQFETRGPGVGAGIDASWSFPVAPVRRRPD